MRITRYLLLVCFMHPDLLWAQPAFRAGTSSVSLEPDSSIFSVALAGYGVPREGRFSITWDALSDAGQLMAISGYGNKVYGITADGNLQVAHAGRASLNWKTIGRCENAVALAVSPTKLYVVKEGNIFTSAITNNNPVFKKWGAAPGVTTLALLNNTLYATTTNNELLQAGVATPLRWKKIGTADGIVSLTADGHRLYALNSGDTLWYIQPQQKRWMQIGRNNGVTATMHARHITVLNKVLYAVDADGKLYKGRHNTRQNLYARAVAIQSQHKTVVIAGLDLTGFNLSFIESIKKTVAAQRDIPASAILINASHTHYAPVTQAWTTWGAFYHTPDSQYLNRIARKAVVRAIIEALDHLQPATITMGRGITDIGLNRRGNANRYKPYDSTLDVIRITGPDQKIRCVLFYTACHPVFKNEGAESYTLNGNFPAVARQLIEEQTKSQHAIFIQGCGGDINPKSPDHMQTGEALAADVLKILAQPMDTLRGDISYALDQVLVPVTPWPADSIEHFKAVNAALPGNLSAEKNVRWCNLMLNRYKHGTVATTLPVYVQTLNIGNWKMVGLSREVVNEYAKAIRGLWPSKKVTVAGYCNDVSSYLPIRWHIQEKHYEGFDSFFWYGQPGIPPLNVLELITEKIRSFNR